MEFLNGEEMKQISKDKFIDGIKWETINLVLTKGLKFIGSVIIARLIAPEHYGYMAIWSVILAFGDVIVIGGVDTILIQKKDLQPNDWNTAFAMCFIRGLVLTLLLFFLAPIISRFYEMPKLKILIRFIGIDFLSQSFIMIGTVKSARSMNYKGLFLADFIATIVAIGGALSGAEMYVLILNTTIHQLVYAIIITIYWKIGLQLGFDKSSAKKILLNGNKAMKNGILDLLTSTISGLYIGKKWSATEVGYYNRSQSLIQILGVESYNVISNVLLPTFSSYQEEKIKLKEVTRKIILLSTYLMFPFMFGIAVCAENLIVLLFTDKWIKAVPFLRIACIYYAFNPLRQLCMNVNYSLGKFKRNNVIEFSRLILNVAVILIFYIWSKSTLMELSFVTSVIAVAVAIMYLMSIRKELEYTCIEIIKDIIPNLVLSLVAVIPCAYICNHINNVILALAISVVVSLLIYIGMSRILHIKIFRYLFSGFEEILRR